jgi:KipI family sensor histidine kinase inhibitor
MAPRRVRPFGDGALVVDLATVDEAHRLSAAISALYRPGIEDVIVGFRSVTVVADPTVLDVAELRDTLRSLPSGPTGDRAGRVVEIPVVFDGADLDEVARGADLRAPQVVDLLSDVDLRVAFVGFAPGFAYLVGLPPALAAVARRPTPRPVVAGGSVALGGGFAGVYPRASPGGWNVVGRTGVALFVPDVPPYALLQAGDLVRFRPSDTAGDLPAPPTRRALRAAGTRRVVVEDPGLLSLVEDGGRLGAARLGVPRGGAADPYARRLANALVGNGHGDAVIEAAARGPTLRFSAPAHVAVVGDVDVDVDGRRVPNDATVPVGAGQRVTVGTPRHGLRAYVAISGGVDIPALLGSRSSDVLSGLGPGALAAGDELGLGPPRRPRGHLRRGAAPDGCVVRVVLGPDAFSPAAVDRLASTTWEVDGSSNRIGVRLRADVRLDAPVETPGSRGMVTGAVQVPPDGRPIALLCDHATVGGYPVIATVATADLGVLGQLRPGDTLRLDVVDMAGAVRARDERERALRDAVNGWYPVRSD